MSIVLKPEIQAILRELVEAGVYADEAQALEAAIHDLKFRQLQMEEDRKAIEAATTTPVHAFDADETMRRVSERWQADQQK